MYVCICHGVTDKDIKRAAKAGAQNLQDIKLTTGCATGCGSCADMALEILNDVHNQNTPEFLKILQPAKQWDKATA